MEKTETKWNEIFVELSNVEHHHRLKRLGNSGNDDEDEGHGSLAFYVNK